MLSERLWELLGFRLQVMEWGFSAPLKWNRKERRFYPAGRVTFWNYGMYQIYVTAAAMFLGLKLIFKHTQVLSKLFQDLEDEAATTAEDPTAIFKTAIDISFVAVFTTVSGIQYLYRKWNWEVMTLFNELVEVDEVMEELFKLQVYLNPTYRRTVALLESLMLFTVIMSLSIPFLFGMFFLQDVEPFHRFLVEELEFEPKLNLETLPLLLWLMWSVLQCSNAAILTLIIGLLYLKTYSFWIKSMQPISLVRGRGFCGRNDDRYSSEYLTDLGYIKGRDLVRIYRIHQVLNKLCNQFFANRIVAMHQATIQIVMIVASFCCVRGFKVILLTPGYQIGFVAAGLCVLVEYLETKIISDAASASSVLRKKVENLTPRNDFVVKAIACSWDLRMQVAYPYFKLGRDTFLEFMHTNISFIVDTLVAVT